MKAHAAAFMILVLALASCTATADKTTPGPTLTRMETATKTVSPPDAQVEPETCGKILYGGDGNIGNAVCRDGRPNVAAVDLFRNANYVTIDLDPSATPQQVLAALCVDNLSLTNPLRLTLYNTANALNRWNFASPPVDADGTLNGTCPPEH
jgi:hypothetical protein